MTPRGSLRGFSIAVVAAMLLACNKDPNFELAFDVSAGKQTPQAAADVVTARMKQMGGELRSVQVDGRRVSIRGHLDSKLDPGMFLATHQLHISLIDDVAASTVLADAALPAAVDRNTVATSKPGGKSGARVEVCGPRTAMRQALGTLTAPQGRRWTLLDDRGRRPGRFCALLLEPVAFRNADVDQAQLIEDEMTGNPQVSVTLSADAAERFGRLTRDHLRRRMAIGLDDLVVSAPVIMSEIGGGKLSITMGGGADPKADATKLVLVLNSEPLHAKPQNVQLKRIGPS